MQSPQFQLHAQIEDRHWWFVARRQILRTVVNAICPPDALRPPVVVDVGCGTGANLAALAGRYRCVGVDTSVEAIDLARSRFPDLTFVCGQAPDDVTDWLRHASVVMMNDVLEHVADDRGLLSRIVAAMPAQSQLLLTVPADMRLWSPHDEAFGHFRRYHAEQLGALWSGLPVRPRLMSYFNCRLYPVVRLARAISQRRGRTAGAANTDFKLPAAWTNRLLAKVFAGERHRLRRKIDSGKAAYGRGVSLMAVLQIAGSPQAPSQTAERELVGVSS